MARSTAVKVLVATALVAAVLLPQAQAVVTSMTITRMESYAPYQDYDHKGIDWEPDEIDCRLLPPNNFTCRSCCNGTIGGVDRETPDFCIPTYIPTCNGKWCAANVTLEARMDVSPTTSNTRMIVSAFPIYFIKQLSVKYITSKPYRVVWNFQIGSAVAIGTFASEPDYYEPYKPLITFSAAQSGQLTGLTTSMVFLCNPLPGATATFQTPKVKCSNGDVEANATVTGCPELWEARYQNAYINLFDGSLPGPTTTTPPTFPNQYPGNNWGEGDRDLNVVTLGSGLVKVMIKRNDVSWPRDDWPARVASIKIGHRLNSDGPDAPWKLSAGKALYEDKDVDGWGAACDCDDDNPNLNTNCPRSSRRLME